MSSPIEPTDEIVECAACGAENILVDGEFTFCTECDVLLTTDAE